MIDGGKKVKNIMNQNRRTEVSKEKNDAIKMCNKVSKILECPELTQE